MTNISSAQWIRDWAAFSLKVWSECNRYFFLNLSQPTRTKHMSKPHEFFEAMAEAKAAMDKLPEIEAQLAAVQCELAQRVSDAQGLQDAITKANQLNMELQDKVRSLEVERDDAGFRRLEAEDRLQTLLGAISSAHGALGDAVKSATPTPEPIKPIPHAESDQVCEEMVAKGVDVVHSDRTIHESKTLEPTSTDESTSMDPLGRVFTVDPPNPTTPVNVEPETPSPVEPQPKPYFGWTSFDKPMSTSWRDFLDGGGMRPHWLTDEEVERDAVERLSTISIAPVAA